MSHEHRHIDTKGGNYFEHIRDFIAGDKIIYESPPDRREKNLELLLNEVKDGWIDKVLSKALPMRTSIHLSTLWRPDLIESPEVHSITYLDSGIEPVSKDKDILGTFNTAGRSLLILGAPGSGKTTTLFQLADALVQKALDDATEPVPVVFNLASWSEKRESIYDWIISRFKTEYYVPPRNSKGWLLQNKIVFLLDGLDEVQAKYRTQCIGEINAFAREYGHAGISVCSRLEEYEALNDRLGFKGAIQIESLYKQQIDAYIEQRGGQFKALSSSLLSNPHIAELASSPLMLSMMSVVFGEEYSEGVDHSAFTNKEDATTYLFDKYTAFMLANPSHREVPYTPVFVKKWLSQLAVTMNAYGKTIFHIEELHPNMLPRGQDVWVYFLVSRIIGAVCCMELLSIMLWLAGLVELNLTEASELHPRLTLGFKLVEGLAWGFSIGFALGLLDAFKFTNRTLLRRFLEWPMLIRLIVHFSSYLLIFWGVLWITFKPSTTSSLIFATGITMGSVWIIRSEFRLIDNDIVTTEKLIWSTRHATRMIVIALLFVVVSRLLKLFTGMSPTYADIDLGILGSLGGATLLVLMGGIRSSIFNGKIQPNQGMQLSIRNALFAASLFGVILGCLGLLVGGFEYNNQDTFLSLPDFLEGWTYNKLAIWGATLGISMSLYAFLWYGGLDVIQHYVLRVILWQSGKIPWELNKFLEYAARRIFLRKVGGGYIFMHRKLLDYFADMEVSVK